MTRYFCLVAPYGSEVPDVQYSSYSTRGRSRLAELLCHDHQGSIFDPPLGPSPVNVQFPGLFKRRNIFCSSRIDIRPHFPGCPVRKFKVNVERIEVRNKQRKSTRFKIKGRGRNGSVGLMNIRERVISKKLSLLLVLEFEWLYGFHHLLVSISSWVSHGGTVTMR